MALYLLLSDALRDNLHEMRIEMNSAEKPRLYIENVVGIENRERQGERGGSSTARPTPLLAVARTQSAFMIGALIIRSVSCRREGVRLRRESFYLTEKLLQTPHPSPSTMCSKSLSVDKERIVGQFVRRVLRLFVHFLPNSPQLSMPILAFVN